MENKSQPDLFGYGIQNEASDVRVHVCPRARMVYVFPTAEGLRAILTGIYRKVVAYQSGVKEKTAEGYVVPPFAIAKCVGLIVRDEAWDAVDFREEDDTSAKGQKAVYLVSEMLKHGLLPLPLDVQVNLNLPVVLQVSGQDIVVTCGERTVRVQVKCDFRGGEPRRGGTGNLFLQVAERNPLKKH